MTRTSLILMAAGGSLAVLLAAFGAEHLFGILPCKLCLWQRWPHGVAVGIGVLALGLKGRTLPVLGALAALTTAGIAVYHSGVERHWWQGPTSCTSGSVAGVAPEDLLNQILAAPVVLCDQVNWELLTLSMANWNALISVGLALIWAAAAATAARR